MSAARQLTKHVRVRYTPCCLRTWKAEKIAVNEGIFAFYEEYNSVAGSLVSNQTVIAVFKNVPPDADGLVPAITGESGKTHSRAVYNPVSIHYLERTCKKIDEERARRVHPEIFYRIDNGEY